MNIFFVMFLKKKLKDIIKLYRDTYILSENRLTTHTTLNGRENGTVPFHTVHMARLLITLNLAL